MISKQVKSLHCLRNMMIVPTYRHIIFWKWRLWQWVTSLTQTQTLDHSDKRLATVACWITLWPMPQSSIFHYWIAKGELIFGTTSPSWNYGYEKKMLSHRQHLKLFIRHFKTADILFHLQIRSQIQNLNRIYTALALHSVDQTTKTWTIS